MAQKWQPKAKGDKSIRRDHNKMKYVKKIYTQNEKC